MRVPMRPQHWLGLLILGLLTAACTPAPSAEVKGATPGAQPSQGASAATTPDKITFSFSIEPVNLDPPRAGGLADQVVTQHIFDPLADRDPAGHVRPRLAERWENPNPTTWRFYLRKGVKFQDGEDLTADVAKFSIERYKSKLSLQASRFANIVDVKVVDPLTFDVTLKDPDPVLPNSFVNNAFMLPPKYIQEKGDDYFAANPIGTGPYKFKEWVRGDHITMVSNDDYWMGKPKIPTVIFKPIPEASTRVAALESGEVDIISEVPPAQVQAIKDSGVADVKAVPGPRAVYIGLRPDGPTPAPMLKDVRVRQAMNYAVNRQAMVDKLLFGYATLLGQPIPPAYLGYNPNVQPYPYDPDKAKALLAEAGYADGFDIQLDYAPRYLTRDQAQALQADLAKVNIRVKLNESDPTQFTNELLAGKIAPMYALSIQGRVGLDAIEIFEVAIITNGSFNWNKYSNPAADDAVNKGRAAQDPKEREKYFQQANQLVHDDPPWIFMWNNQSIWGVRKGINWSPRSDDLVLVYDDVK